MQNYEHRKEYEKLCKDVILRLYEFGNESGFELLDKKRVERIRNKATKDHKLTPPRNIELIKAYHKLIDDGVIEANNTVLGFIIKRKIRSLSGIANITVMLKSFGCPGKCIFCPTQPGMPKSYFSNQPAMLRATRNNFNAYMQVKTRLNGLKTQGHDITKIDIRTAGGTWSSYLDDYQEHFIKSIYFALNEGAGEMQDVETVEKIIQEKTLEELIEENETANSRCVGLWIETRPDWVTHKEIKKLRRFGVTGIELGIQTTDDKVNEFNKRGHGLEESIRATEISRDAGLKICHHLMPNLPTSTLESDLQTIEDTFLKEDLNPDHIKIYPCMVVPFTELAKMVKEDPSIYTPYTDPELIELLIKTLKIVPKYCRVIRVLRDFPSDLVLEGSKTLNLRQILEDRGVVSQDIRAREIKDLKVNEDAVDFEIIEYTSNNGREFFISLVDTSQDKLLGLLRLRLKKDLNTEIEEIKNTAIIREVHVYGQKQTLKKDSSLNSQSQHRGYGKKLMAKAEEIAKAHDFKKISVISAIGTRKYYEKIGYKKGETYMLKML
ncbi:hypothetical protein CL656_05555 [bacterium]|mgnify:FL=1|nr:hypothetical protein [bacterium]